ncbi:hypothetical protein EXE49_15590 [Halorubrum sp. ASP121]|uniref:DUF7827 domain-containing protein n=1 Tax=Halorubrum sp. ASP121 TaxID=1855858 RepID=UPI0010F7EE7B|nr:hypothetical protein [Halorubrum sp. ASP121]TKX48695.1 hypothetical protein EXE49_15590 [Halorubrum sp. ASP121]
MAILFLAVVCLAMPLSMSTAAQPQSAPAVGFDKAQTTVTQGDVATLGVQMRDTDEVTLTIQAPNQQYQSTLHAYDTDEDGSVTVQLNTLHPVGVDKNNRFTAAGSDSVRLVSESGLSEGAALNTGRYNLIVSSDKTSVAAVLMITEPVNPNSTTTAVPAETSYKQINSALKNKAQLSTTASPDTADTDSLEVARGDEFWTRLPITGIGGILTSSTPSSNLVFPADSTPGVETTHTIEVNSNETVSFSSVSVQYQGSHTRSHAATQRVTQSDIDVLGIDANKNGYVDRSLKGSIQSIQTSTDGRLAISLDQPVEIPKNNTLRVAYDIENPEVTGPQDVSVTLQHGNTVHQSNGVITYGLAGQGTLGHGVDLRLISTEGDSPTDPLAVVNPVYNDSISGLAVGVDTHALEPGEYAIMFDVGESAPSSVPRVSHQQSFTVSEPTAELTNHSISNSTRLSLTADTNLASNSSVIIRVTADEKYGGVSQVVNCVATVDTDGTISCTLELSQPADEFNIDVAVKQDGTVIAGPTKIN